MRWRYELSQHGYRQELARQLRLRDLLAYGLIKRMLTVWLRLENNAAIVSVGCARPLEDAYRRDLVGWARTLTSLDLLDTYQLVAQAGRAPIGNANHTVVVAVDKALLPAPREAYRGAHRRLRHLVTRAGY